MFLKTLRPRAAFGAGFEFLVFVAGAVEVGVEGGEVGRAVDLADVVRHRGGVVAVELAHPAGGLFGVAGAVLVEAVLRGGGVGAVAQGAVGGGESPRRNRSESLRNTLLRQ